MPSTSDLSKLGDRFWRLTSSGEFLKMVIKYSGEDYLKSTYSSFYAKQPVNDQQPITLRHQPTQLILPELQHEDNQMVECRTHVHYIDRKKYARPIALTHDNPVCLGLGCFTDAPLESAHKEIVSCPPPKDRKFKLKRTDEPPVEVWDAKDMLRAGEHLDDMIIRLRSVASTMRQQQRECLPVPKWKVPRTTLERNADVVRQRPARYESSVGVWQTAALAWDRAQSRRLFTQESSLATRQNVTRRGGGQKTTSRATTEQQEQQTFADYREQSPQVIVDQSRVRTLPGYGGFVPREPVEVLKDPQRERMFQTSSSSTYRNFPGYKVPGLHSKGPMSEMVTLVYPCNPFRRTPSSTQIRINALY